MNWIKENKFVTSTIGIAVVASGVLLYLGYSARSEAKITIEKSNSSISQINRLKVSSPFPNEKNKKKVVTGVANYAKDAMAFQNKLVAFRPGEMIQFSDRGFGTVMSEYRKHLTNYYREKGVALQGEGENVAFGLEEYRGGALAKGGATKLLNYQRSALEWVFEALADTGPTSLNNVFRTQLAEEISDIVEAKPRKGKKTKKGQPKKLSVYRELPVEITFTGSEKTLKDFLAKLSNAEKYFFVIRSVTIHNLVNESPSKKDAEFEDEAGSTGLDGEAIVFASSEKPILKQVTGTEEIKVHLKLGLLMFKDKTEVPYPIKVTKDRFKGGKPVSVAKNGIDKNSLDKLESKEVEEVTEKKDTLIITMSWLKENYDKAALGGAAVITLAVVALIFTGSSEEVNKVKNPKPKNVFKIEAKANLAEIEEVLASNSEPTYGQHSGTEVYSFIAYPEFMN